MSTSSDGVVVRDLPAGSTEAPTHYAELRQGDWTRLGSGGNLGDQVTEGVLGRIAERAHQAARAQGYAQGWAEGRRVALVAATAETERLREEAAADRDRQAVEHRAALAALEAATVQLAARLAQALDDLAGEAVEVALSLTEAILGREVASAADPGGDALRRALAHADPQVTTTVRLHPADRALVDPAVTQGHRVVLVDDPGLARGDAVAETDRMLVDATVAAALDRVREVLTR